MKVLHIFTLATTAAFFFDGQFRYLVDNGYEIHIVASPANIDNFCEYNHIVYYPIDVVRRIDPIADIKTIYSLVKLIKQHKYDAVFGHTPKGAMVAMIASKIAGIKIRVYYRHGLIYTTATGIKRKLFKFIEQFTSSLATNIVNVSPSLSQLAVQDCLNKEKKQVVIGYGTCGGIDAINRFNPELLSSEQVQNVRNKYNISESDFVIGFCGRICKEKGIRELIDAFRISRNNNPSKLLIVGAYDTRDILPEEYKRIIDTDSDIIYTGRIEQQLLPLYYSMMDLFVFPSYREGFGMCVIEASAMEVPALVSRSHGCIDSIQEHITGEYISLDPENIANSIAVMQGDNNRKNYGINGRRVVLERFDHSVMWKQVLQFYRSLESNDYLFEKKQNRP